MYAVCPFDANVSNTNGKRGVTMTFNSIYVTHINEFIEFKRNFGFNLRDVEYVFIQFDRLVLQSGEDKIGISKELYDVWCAKPPNESDGT